MAAWLTPPDDIDPVEDLIAALVLFTFAVLNVLLWLL